MLPARYDDDEGKLSIYYSAKERKQNQGKLHIKVTKDYL